VFGEKRPQAGAFIASSSRTTEELRMTTETNAAPALASAHPPAERQGHFHRSIGSFSAIAINMTQMCGIGPFITIPIMVATMGGPQAIIGWIIGALLAIADGLVWSELGAAMPGAGGSYLYLRQAFQYRSGKLMPFLFAWTAMISIPLIMSTGVIGMAQYLGYFFPNMSWLETHLIGLGATVLLVVALYRRIESVRYLVTGLWIVMLVTVVLTIAACYSHFNAALAFTYPPGAWTLDGRFFAGLGAGLLVAVYDYLGYNTTALMGSELKNPGKTMPRSIIVSVVAMMAIYLIMNIGVLGAVPWQTVAKSSSVVSLAVTTAWGPVAASIITALIVVTAFASCFAGLLGGSRVPFNAARDGAFFAVFGRLHPKLGIPHVALIVMGVITAIGSFLDLGTLISVLIAVGILLQGIAQIVALSVLRRRQPGLHRPYKQWLYPVPSIIAVLGWIFVYVSAGILPIVLSLVWIAVGCVCFVIWAKINKAWPFAPVVIDEAHLTTVEAHEHSFV
jgi:amino acid transporter